MIEINLVPDVKQELIRAQRIRVSVISGSLVVGVVVIGIVVLLALWVFGVQTARGLIVDNTIKSQSAKLAKVPDISDVLTLQNQLTQIPVLYDSVHMDSRIFDALDAFNPPAPNNVQVDNMSVDTTAGTVTIQAETAGGYSALETYKKTIAATKLSYKDNGQSETTDIASNIVVSTSNYGQSASGAAEVNFTLSFTYAEPLLDRASTDAVIIAPTKTNATDSYLGVPSSLFTDTTPSATTGESN